MRINNILFITFITLILTSCCSDYELTVWKGEPNQIKINNKDLENFICSEEKYETSISYYLDLVPGKNTFRIRMNDGTVIDTSIFIAGEAYLGIDLETKQIFGF